MKTRDFRFAHVEQFLEFDFGTDDEVLQLSAGGFDFTLKQVELEGIQLLWGQIGAAFLSREIYRGSGFEFGFPFQSSCLMKSFGHEIDYGHAVVWQPDRELEYIAPTGTASLIISVDAALVDLLGWTLNDAVWQQIPKSCLRKLQRTCRLATRAAEKQASISLDTGVDVQSLQADIKWRDRILVDLEATLEPWLTALKPGGKITLPGTHYFRLFKDAELFFEQHDPDQSVSMSAVAEAIGVPRRTLFHAFRRWMGIGPHAYLQLIRLHKLRKGLIAATSTETTVTTLATDLGFNQLGRLSGIYREHFGEYPRDTLRRT